MPRKKQPEKDAIELGAEAADAELSGFFHDVASALRFQEFRLPLDTFRKMRRLVLLDRFTKEQDELIAKRLDVAESEVARMRATSAYEQMTIRAEEAWDRLCKPRTVRELVADHWTQDEIFRRTIRLARAGPNTGDLHKHLAAFNDRAMPLITKEAPGKVLMIQLGDVERIRQVEAEAFGELEADFDVTDG